MLGCFVRITEYVAGPEKKKCNPLNHYRLKQPKSILLFTVFVLWESRILHGVK